MANPSTFSAAEKRTDFQRNLRKEGRTLVDLIVEVGRLAIADKGAEQPQLAPWRHTHRNLALLADRNLVQFIVEQCDLEARRRPAHRSGAHFVAASAAVRDHHHALGLPVAFVNGQPGRTFPRFDHFGIQRLAGAHAMAQVRKAISSKLLTHDSRSAVGGAHHVVIG